MAKRARRTYQDLRAYFRYSGDTQAQMAGRLNRSQAWVSRVVNGKQEPSLAEALLLSEMAGVPLESLIVRPVQASEVA